MASWVKIQPTHLKYWNPGSLFLSRLQLFIQPTHLKYWNIINIKNIPIQRDSTDTFEVLKLTCFFVFFFVRLGFNRHIWSIETKHIFSHSIFLFHSTDTFEVLKQNIFFLTVFSYFIQPTHLKYWNKIIANTSMTVSSIQPTHLKYWNISLI